MLLITFKIGSDHRAVRTKISMNPNKERRKLIVRKDWEKKLVKIQDAGEKRKHLQANLTASVNIEDVMGTEQTNRQIRTAIKEANTTALRGEVENQVSWVTKSHN